MNAKRRVNNIIKKPVTRNARRVNTPHEIAGHWNKNKNDFMQFLSSKVKIFDEFKDMVLFVSSLLKASSYPFFIVDKNMKIQYMNSACLDFTGLKFDDSIGKLDCTKVFNSNLCETNCAIKQAMKTKEPVIGKRVKVQDKFNKEHTIIVTAGALVDAKGKVLGGFEVWRDAMPDKELTLRVNQLLDTLSDYCCDAERFLETVHEWPSLGEPKSKENWDNLVNSMKKRTNDLLNYSKSLLNSSCWDILNCPAERQVQCPAFPNNGLRCWEVDYTWCYGQMQGRASEKKDTCKNCLIYIKNKKSQGSREALTSLKP